MIQLYPSHHHNPLKKNKKINLPPIAIRLDDCFNKKFTFGNNSLAIKSIGPWDVNFKSANISDLISGLISAIT